MIFTSLKSKLEAWLQLQWLKRGIWAWCMVPWALIFGLIIKIRQAWFANQNNQTRIPVPVVVVGNIYVGGTGKTPVVIALVNALTGLGWRPGVISRGYGTDIGSEPLTGQGKLDAKDFGDEPAMIASQTNAPISVHPNRVQACRKLLARYPEVNLVISDDGLQHLRLSRDLELVVQDRRGAGNGWLLPAGPLREPVSRLKTVHAILTREDCARNLVSSPKTGNVRTSSVTLQVREFKNLAGGLCLNTECFLANMQGRTIAAVAGIAHPERFFNAMRKLGLNLSETLSLPDHFQFDHSPFSTLRSEAIIVTSKDAIKLKLPTDPRIWVADSEIIFSDPKFICWLDDALHNKAKLLTNV